MNDKTLKTMFSHDTVEWFTPPYLFEAYNQIYHFVLDPCTSKDNPLGCKYFYTKEDDGLSKNDWSIGNVWINPPYGREIEKWVAKGKAHATAGKGTVVMLLPGRIDTRWFHRYIWDRLKGTPQDGVDFEPLEGRVKFLTATGDQSNSPAFPSMVVTFFKMEEREREK